MKGQYWHLGTETISTVIPLWFILLFIVFNIHFTSTYSIHCQYGGMFRIYVMLIFALTCYAFDSDILIFVGNLKFHNYFSRFPQRNHDHLFMFIIVSIYLQFFISISLFIFNFLALFSRIFHINVRFKMSLFL